ncbi:MAG: helix-hairpin-helix domain-containing protein [Elusimicrobiota bacterium]|nr:helix-hairpin-helix domain-containing protein [Endomicrobiia bacterium]MDW8165949.1 helix-hairpin-helix domain-containing protein [Elusimicrobiota bacterium]
MRRKILLWFIENKFIIFLYFFLYNFSFCIVTDKIILANKASVSNVCFVGYDAVCFLESYLLEAYFSKTNFYDLKDLESNSFYIKFNKNTFSFGLLYNNFGKDIYKENFLDISCGVSIRKIFISTNLGFFNSYFKNYGNKNFVICDLGFFGEVYYNVSCGFKIKSITLLSTEEIPKQLILVNRVKIFKIATSYIDIVKSPKDSIFLRVAEDIKLFSNKKYNLNLCFGLETATINKLPKYSFGLGVLYNSINSEFVFDYSIVYTPYLSYQHLFSFGVNFFKLTHIENKRYLIDLNTASEKELQKIPGIGPKIAKRIIEYREKYGKFNSIYELIYIPGITTNKLKKIKEYLYVEEK